MTLLCVTPRLTNRNTSVLPDPFSLSSCDAYMTIAILRFRIQLMELSLGINTDLSVMSNTLIWAPIQRAEIFRPFWVQEISTYNKIECFQGSLLLLQVIQPEVTLVDSVLRFTNSNQGLTSYLIYVVNQQYPNLYGLLNRILFNLI